MDTEKFEKREVSLSDEKNAVPTPYVPPPTPEEERSVVRKVQSRPFFFHLAVSLKNIRRPTSICFHLFVSGICSRSLIGATSVRDRMRILLASRLTDQPFLRECADCRRTCLQSLPWLLFYNDAEIFKKMSKDLHLSSSQYNNLLTIFYVAYIIGQATTILWKIIPVRCFCLCK
jgi:hypothetical protein